MSNYILSFVWLTIAVFSWAFGGDELEYDIAFWGCLIIANIYIAAKSPRKSNW